MSKRAADYRACVSVAVFLQCTNELFNEVMIAKHGLQVFSQVQKMQFILLFVQNIQI